MPGVVSLRLFQGLGGRDANVDWGHAALLDPLSAEPRGNVHRGRRRSQALAETMPSGSIAKWRLRKDRSTQAWQLVCNAGRVFKHPEPNKAVREILDKSGNEKWQESARGTQRRDSLDTKETVASSQHRQRFEKLGCSLGDLRVVAVYNSQPTE